MHIRACEVWGKILMKRARMCCENTWETTVSWSMFPWNTWNVNKCYWGFEECNVLNEGVYHSTGHKVNTSAMLESQGVYFIPACYATSCVTPRVTLNSTFLLSYRWGESHNQKNKYREISNSNNRYYTTELDEAKQTWAKGYTVLRKVINHWMFNY